MENAKLGDAMIENLRASGTAAEKEKQAAMGTCYMCMRTSGLPPSLPCTQRLRHVVSFDLLLQSACNSKRLR